MSNITKAMRMNVSRIARHEVPLRVVVSFLWSVLFVAHAHAGELAPIRLVYARAEQASACPDRDALLGRIAASLGSSPFRGDAARALNVEIRRENGLFLASMQLLEANEIVGERSFDSADEDCSELADAIVFAAVLVLDPLAYRRSVATSAPDARVDSLVTPEPIVVDDERPPERAPASSVVEPASRWRLAIGVGGGFSFLTAPRVSGDVGGFFEARHEAFSLQVGGRYDFGASVPAGQGTLSSSLAFGDLAACGHYRFFYGCALARVGAYDTGTADLPDASRVTSLYAGLGARVGAEVAFNEWLFGRVAFDLAAAVTKSSFFAGDFVIWRTERVAGALEIFMVAKIP